ncbi:MAG: hypothetical protein GY861_22320 [bacterium]|nr:hypothetical protein [bacterium]
METSYFGNIENLDTNRVVIISVGIPRWLKDPKSYRYAKELMPTWEMVKRRKYPYNEYIKLIESRGVTPEQVEKDYSDKILICHEKNPTFWHRS